MPVPPPICVADLTIQTRHQFIRTRTYWASDNAPADESQLSVIADAIKSAFTPHLPNVLPSNHFFSRVEAHWYGGGGTHFFANSTAAAGQGLIVDHMPDEDGLSDTEDTMPDDTCLIIQKKTGLVGRANQGRVFIGGISEQLNNGGIVPDDKVALVKTLAAKFNTDVNVAGGGYTTVLHARHYNRKDNIMRPITKVYAVKVIGSRMDRRPKQLYERL